jgi:hypothetical protein
MSDFLIYAARLQDAGVCSLWVSLGSDKEGTRLMHVSPDIGTPPELAARYPTRTFELCGTDRVLERVKDEMIYSEGGVTPEKVKAAIEAHPLLRDDLCALLSDSLLANMPTDEEIEAYEPTPEDEAAGLRFAEKMKATLRGIDIARQRDAMKTTT